MDTVTERVRQMAEGITIDVGKLLGEYSQISCRQLSSDDLILITSSPYQWNDLGLEGRQLQSKVLDDYRRYSSILRALLRVRPRQDIEHFDDSERAITEIIQQDSATSYKTPKEACQPVFPR